MVIAELGGTNWIIIYLTYLALIFGVINVCLLLGLLYSYWKTYKQIKSGFTIGLLYFTSLILIQNVVITLFLGLQVILPPSPPPEILVSEFHEPVKPLFFVNLIQLIALSILFKITRK